MIRRVQFQPTGRALALKADAYGATFEIGLAAPGQVCLEGEAAVVDIVGPLVQHKGSMGGCWTSYEEITECVKAACDTPAKAVILRIDSPGGDALGVGECARELRAICRAAGKPLFAFCDGMIASAAYALATSADKIITPPAGVLGSVGVYQPLIDSTAADRAMGLSITMVASGARKLDGNPHIETSAAAVAETQRRVDGLAELFFGLVAEMRQGVSKEDMRALEGAAFLGAEAVSVGLADAVGSWTDVLAMVAGTLQATAPAARAAEGSNMADEPMKDDDKKARMAKAFKAMADAFNAFQGAFGDDEDITEEKKDDDKDEEKKSKSSEDDDKKIKSESDDKKARASKEEEPVKEQASASFALAQRIHALEAERASEKAATEREKLLAMRPDFSATIRATLATLPISELKKAVETWDRIPLNPAAAASVTATQGARQDVDAVTPHIASMLDEKMGISVAPKSAITREAGGFATVFQPLTPEQARARLDEMNKAGKVA
jgi:ClpP class serine protease